MKKINVAILGAGNIAQSMSQALQGLKEEVNMYAVASRSLDKAQAFASEWGFAKAYGSYEELAEDDAIDLVYVATPHSEHFANAMLLVEHGRNCLIEKAFCGNAAQAEALIAYAQERGVLVAEAMWTRYMPSRQVIQDVLDSGAIGEVKYLEADFSVPIVGVQRLTDPALAGGALLDLGIYPLTVADMYWGSDYETMTVEVDLTDTGVDATQTVTLEYANGKVAKLKSSSVDQWSNYAKFVGDKGYIYYETTNLPEELRVYDGDGIICETIDLRPDINGYEYEVLECRQLILDGENQPHSMPHATTIKMMKWMDEIRKHMGVVYPFD